jgi:4-amino-4-deoxy-L-arabinose transferase-like glycosyltransferase
MALDPPAPVDATRAAAAGRFGFWISVVTAAVTVVTFALAMTALPDTVPYPFTSQVIVDQWPGDYLWMYPAMILMVLFVAWLVAIHQDTPPVRRTYSLLALSVGVIAAAVLLITYYIQVTVMQPSLEKGQLDGWAMLTMYNPSGVFIALEELGYLLMSLAFVCLAAVYVQPSRLERMWVSTKGAERSPRRVQRRSRGQPSIAPPSFPDGMWARIR